MSVALSAAICDWGVPLVRTPVVLVAPETRVAPEPAKVPRQSRDNAAEEEDEELGDLAELLRDGEVAAGHVARIARAWTADHRCRWFIM